MIGKDKLVFDTTDFETINASDSVGSYVRSSASGALVTNHSSIEAGTISFTFVDGDVTVGTDTIAETAHGLFTGDKVQVSNSGGALPTGLSAATDYYVIRVDANSFKLAASPQDAEQGNPVDITAAAGGGTHTLTEQDTDRRSLDAYIMNPSLAVTATDLDIRDLTQADEITVFQGTSPWVIGDGGGSITVDATDLDIRDLDASQDNVAISDGTDTLEVNADGSINITDNGGSLTVDATDLDIRDLTHVSDSIRVGDGTDFLAVNADGSLNITDNGGSLTVDPTQLDIDDLNATDDAVQAWTFDGTGNAITSSGGALDVNIQSSDIEIDVEDDKANTALNNTQKDVTSSAALLASQLADRRFMWVQNLGSKAIYVGESGVTTANGLRLSPGSVLEIRLGPAVSMHAVSQDGNAQDTRILEAS